MLGNHKETTSHTKVSIERREGRVYLVALTSKSSQLALLRLVREGAPPESRRASPSGVITPPPPPPPPLPALFASAIRACVTNGGKENTQN